MKVLRIVLLLALVAGMFAHPASVSKVSAVGEAATKIGVFAPADAVSGRDSALVVTALEDGSTVDIVDDGADGDTDDSHTGLTMNTGQSYIVYIKEGAVNDDGTGTLPKKDGDFFWVKSNKPVLAHTLSVNTDWQHDFVPADNHRMSGTSFYVYTPNFASVNSSVPEVMDVFAYNDNTDVKLLDITGPVANVKTTSGQTTVVKDNAATTLYTTSLNAGQDLLETNAITWRLAAGHTYHVLANKAITVIFGAIGKNRSTSRDGGDYVPGKNGFSADKTFYFTIPNSTASERELRLVSYSKPADVTVRGWNTATKVWDKIGTYTLSTYGHTDLIGNAAGTYLAGGVTTGYYLFEVTSDNDISVFEANWMETGSYGTSDLATYISSEDGTGAGNYFLAYMGPPGSQANGVQASHIVVSTTKTAKVHLYDPDSFGEYIELYNTSSQAVDLSGWKLTNKAGWTLTIPTGKTVAPLSTFLLEYHEKASDTASNYVYGVDFSKFKLDNGTENLLLQNPTGTYSDSLAYNDTPAWGLHGVFHALERKNPNKPFIAGNNQDSSVLHAKTTANLGIYYGTPGVQQGTVGNGTGNVVINEVMSGRIYQSLNLTANSYYQYDASTTDWEALNNGETPGTNLGNPEKPYIVVDSDVPVTVMASNWNDNWMTFATGGQPPDPEVHSNANFYQQTAGSTVVVSTFVEDKSTTLNNPVTSVELPSTVQYTNGGYSTPQQIAAVTPTETHNGDGSTTITWIHDKPLPPGDVYRFDVSGTISGSTPTNSLVQSVVKVSGNDAATNTVYASQDSNVITVGPPEPTSLQTNTVTPTATSDVIINEVNIAPLCTEQWIELHNKSTMLISLNGWELSNENGFIYRFPAGTFIANDGYLVVHLSNGANTATDLYTTQAFGGALGTSEDQVALYKSATHSSTTIVDFVQWGTGALVDATQQVNAVTAGQWPSGAIVAAPAVGQSVGRDRSATDTNTIADWTNSGGKDSNHPTSGVINIAVPGTDVTPPSSVNNLDVQPVLGQEGSVRLTWSNPPNGDLAGVKIIRSFDTYPSRFNDEVPVYSGIAGTFAENSLPPGQPVYYTAFAYDDKGNVACPVPTSKARAIIPQRQFMAFEDQKGIGWVDWDTNDMIFMEDSAVSLDLNGVKKIGITFTGVARGSAYHHTVNLSMLVNGGASATVDYYDAAGTLLSSSTQSYGNFVDLVVFADTKVALPPNPNGDGFTNNVVRGYVKQPGFKTVVTIAVSNPSLNPTTSADLPPYDPWVHVIDTGQNIHLMQAGSIGNTQTVWNATSPLFGRDIPLGLSFNQLWKWPKEATAIWDAYPNYAQFILSGGALNPTWYLNPALPNIWVDNNGQPFTGALSRLDATTKNLTTPELPCKGQFAACAAGWPQPTSSSIFASPLITDVKKDGNQEIVVASQDGTVNILDKNGTPLPGWPRYTYTKMRSSPAVGDIDGDGQNEIVVAGDSYVFAWHADGTQVTGFPVYVDPGFTIRSSPVLADLNGQPGLEIVLATGGLKVFALDGAGQILPGFPFKMGGIPESYGNLILNSSPAVGDLNGDNIPEIVAGSTDGKIYAWKLDGTLVNKLWPQTTGDWIYGSPVIVDLNLDGVRDVVAASGDGRIYAWSGNGLPLTGFPVRMRGGIVSSPVVVDLNGDGALEVIVSTLPGKVYVFHSDGTLMKGWPRDVLSQTYSSPVVGDLDGNGTLEVIVGSHSGKVYAWHDNGLPMVDWPKTTGDWVVGSPALGDLDGNGKTEVVAGSFDGKIYVWETNGNPADAPWPTFRGGAEHSGLVNTVVPIDPIPPAQAYYFPIVEK